MQYDSFLTLILIRRLIKRVNLITGYQVEEQ